MPVLSNPKHERFALGLSKGLKQGRAYEEAGYAPNKGAASRLAQSPKIVDRVAELRGEINDRINTALANPEDPEKFEALSEMGIDMNWIGGAFKKIYEKALDTAQLGAANTAVQNLQKLVEIEQGGRKDDDGADADAPTFKDALKMVEEMRRIAEASRSVDPDPEMRDITPGEDVSDAEALPLLPDLDAYLADGEET